jgi:hypothetical protein
MLVYASLEMLALPFSSFLVMSSILQHDLGWLSCSNYHAPPPFNLLFFRKWKYYSGIYTNILHVQPRTFTWGFIFMCKPTASSAWWLLAGSAY